MNQSDITTHGNRYSITGSTYVLNYSEFQTPIRPHIFPTGSTTCESTLIGMSQIPYMMPSISQSPIYHNSQSIEPFGTPSKRDSLRFTMDQQSEIQSKSQQQLENIPSQSQIPSQQPLTQQPIPEIVYTTPMQTNNRQQIPCTWINHSSCYVNRPFNTPYQTSAEAYQGSCIGMNLNQMKIMESFEINEEVLGSHELEQFDNTQL